MYRIAVANGRARVAGHAGKYRVHHQDSKQLVLVREGYGENPGSRYSMLHSYYPAEFQVYRVIEPGLYERVAVFPVRREVK